MDWYWLIALLDQQYKSHPTRKFGEDLARCQPVPCENSGILAF